MPSEAVHAILLNADTGAEWRFQFQPHGFQLGSFETTWNRTPVRGRMRPLLEFDHGDQAPLRIPGFLHAVDGTDDVEGRFFDLLPLWLRSSVQGRPPRCVLVGVGGRAYTGYVQAITDPAYGRLDTYGNPRIITFTLAFALDEDDAFPGQQGPIVGVA